MTFVSVVNLCALVNGGQHLIFFLGVLDGDIYGLLLATTRQENPIPKPFNFQRRVKR